MGVGLFKRKVLIDFGIDLSWDDAHWYIDTFFDKLPEMFEEKQRRIKYAKENGRAYSDVGGLYAFWLGLMQTMMKMSNG